MSIASADYYNVTYGGPVTDALVTTWASNNSVANATYWIRLYQGQQYVVSASKLSKREAKNTLAYRPNPQGTLA